MYIPRFMMVGVLQWPFGPVDVISLIVAWRRSATNKQLTVALIPMDDQKTGNGKAVFS